MMSTGRQTYSPEQRTRYRGHLSLCEIDLSGQKAIMDSRVLIIGCGGLGSPVALYLASAGVGTLGLMDADNVSLSNLQRQIIHSTADLGRAKTLSAADKLKAINPEVNAVCINEKLSSGNAREIIGDYDLVVDCTDNLDTRLLISDTCVEMDKKLVFGAVSRFSGQVFSHVPGSATYRDIFDQESMPDGSEDLPCSINGILNTVVGVTGTLQATEALKLICGFGDALTNRLLTFDALTMEFNTFDVKPVE